MKKLNIDFKSKKFKIISAVMATIIFVGVAVGVPVGITVSRNKTSDDESTIIVELYRYNETTGDRDFVARDVEKTNKTNMGAYLQTSDIWEIEGTDWGAALGLSLDSIQHKDDDSTKIEGIWGNGTTLNIWSWTSNQCSPVPANALSPPWLEDGDLDYSCQFGLSSLNLGTQVFEFTSMPHGYPTI